MPTLKTPLYGGYTRRSFVASDSNYSRFENAIITPVVNSVGKTVTYYTEKRAGIVAETTISANKRGYGVFYSRSVSYLASAFENSGGTGIDLWVRYSSTNVNCGQIASALTFFPTFTDVVINNITYILITTTNPPAGSASGTGWFLASDAVTNTAYTCDGNNSTTITDIKISGVNSVAGLYVGQKLTAASNGLTGGARIVSINAGAFSAVLDTATTGGAFNDLAITKEPVAKIIDTDFPTNIVGGFAEKDGYISIMTADQKVYHSDLNSVVSWTSTNFLTCGKASGIGVGVVKYKSFIAAFTTKHIEFLYNAGNASGSVFSSSAESITSLGASPIFCSAIVPYVDDTLYFVGADCNIYKLSGYSLQEISTLGMLPRYSATPLCSAFFYNMKKYICISGIGDQMLYCVDDGTVSQILILNSNTMFTNSNSTVYVVTDYSGSGKIYTMPDVTGIIFTDDGSSFTMSIELALDMGTNARKFANELRVMADIQASGTLDVSWSDDSGSTYTTAISIPLTSNRMQITGLGSWEGSRLFRFRHSANTAFRSKGIEIDYTVAK